IAKADEAAQREPEFAPTEASRGAQQAHLRRLRDLGRYPGCTFGSSDQLSKAVLSSTVLDLLAKERGGEQSRHELSFPYVGLIAVPFVLLLTPLLADRWVTTLGIALAAPLALLLTVSSLALALIYARYFGVLSAVPGAEWSQERQGYDALREHFATGG